MFFSRGPNKIQNPYTLKDMYAAYVESLVDGEQSPLYVTYETYITLCSDYYVAIMDYLLEEGGTYKMPYGMGKIRVAKHKVKIKKNNRMPIDWEMTFKHNKKVVCLNEHSDGFRYFFFWSKPNMVVNKFLYRLVFTRQNKRRMAQLIKVHKKDYFEA